MTRASPRPAPSLFLFLALFLAALAAGCVPQRRYVSQDEALEAVARAAEIAPSPDRYRLRHAEVSSDVITLHYQGVAQAGDRAWLTRFASKNTEQRFDDLVRLDALLQAIGEGKDGFEASKPGRREVDGLQVDYASYRFRSPLYGDGRPVIAGGIAAITHVEESPAAIVYHLNVTNIEGDRPALGFEELAPLLEAIPR